MMSTDKHSQHGRLQKGYMYVTLMVHAWSMYGIRMVHAWYSYVMRMVPVWYMYGAYMGYIWYMYRTCRKKKKKRLQALASMI